MTTLEKYLRDNHGNPIATRLKNRNRGGDNNAKGNAFETEFAIHQVAKLFVAGGQSEATVIESQAEELVDDLVCTNTTLGAKDNYQLKDSPTVRWGSGIAGDFQIQQDINTTFFKVPNSQTILVVSDEKCHARLVKKMPAAMNGYASCLHFKTDTFNSLLASNDPQIQPFKDLCAFPDEPDKVTTVWQALNGAWQRNKFDAVSAKQVVEHAAQGYEPVYFRLNSGADISDDLKALLDKVSGLTYSVYNGFLVIVIKGCLDESFEIGSDKLKELESQLSAQPVLNWIDFIEAFSRGDV
jgi:hypothetical protein